MLIFFELMESERPFDGNFFQIILKVKNGEVKPLSTEMKRDKKLVELYNSMKNIVYY
jgi:hypothetical protein